jgi:hypothetical protein
MRASSPTSFPQTTQPHNHNHIFAPPPPLPLNTKISVSEGSRIRSFAAAADLRRAVVCKWDSTVVVHDLESGQRLATLQRWGERDSATGHTSAVNQVGPRLQLPSRPTGRCAVVAGSGLCPACAAAGTACRALRAPLPLILPSLSPLFACPGADDP